MTENVNTQREQETIYKENKLKPLIESLLKTIHLPALFREDYTEDDELALDKRDVRKWKPRLLSRGQFEEAH